MSATQARARALLRRADALLAEAAGADDPADRFLGAYVAALRAAGALLAVVDPVPKRGASRSAWVRMALADPEFDQWSAFFEEWSARRASIEAGTVDRIGSGDADAFFARVGAFLHRVDDRIAGDREAISLSA